MLKTIALCVLLCILFSGCAMPQEQKEEHTASEFMGSYMPKDMWLADNIYRATDIVIAKYEGTETQEHSVNYRFTVESSLWGNPDIVGETLEAQRSPDHDQQFDLRVGKTYIVPLVYRNDVFRERYIFPGGYLTFWGKRITGYYHISEKIDVEVSNMDELNATIQNIKETSDNAKQSIKAAYTKSSSLNDIVATGTNIIRVKVVKASQTIFHDVHVYECELVENIKGSAADYLSVKVFPGTVEVGKEYIMIVSAFGESDYFDVASKENSIIEVTDKQMLTQLARELPQEQAQKLLPEASDALASEAAQAPGE